MKLSDILVPELALVATPASSREELIHLLLKSLASVRELNVELALHDVLAREKRGGTVVAAHPVNVALPHAATAACKQALLAMTVLREPLQWTPEEPTSTAQCVFLLLVPPHMHALCLKMMGRICRLAAQPEVLRQFVASATSEQLTERFARAEAPLGELSSPEGLPTFGVLGAGNGGLAMAGHLAMSGCRVHLWNRRPERLEPIIARGGIEVGGELRGFAPLHRITSDPAAALEGVDVAMIVVPATAHREVAQTIAPHLREGQIIVLNPGRTGGALEVAHVLRGTRAPVMPYIAEAQTLLYASRVTNPGQVHIYGIKNSVPLATLPAYDIVDVLPVIRKVLPQFVPGDNVLKTSLDNIGAVFHPAITLLNAGRIEDTHGNFEFYVEGVTRAVAAVLEALDRERVSVAAGLGIRALTAREWLYLAYDAAGKTLLEAMRANPGYGGIKAPATIEHRYICEDVPASLVPLASLGEMLGIPTPTIRAVVDLASAMHGVNYWREGRTVEHLGLKGMSVKEIRLLAVGAELPPRDAGDQEPSARSLAGSVFEPKPRIASPYLEP